MQVVKRIPYLGSLILLAYMPFHIFLSQSLSLATGGLEVWKLAKDIILCTLVLFTICLAFWQGRTTKTFKLLLFFAVAYGALHLGLWIANPDLYNRTAMLGTLYNMRLPLFLILGYGSALLLPKFVFSSVIKLVLVVSTVVAGLGVLQYFLPHDLLTHLGYSLERGARPVFTIDTNSDLIRIMSTLREPNALGAYLTLPAVALVTIFLRSADKNKRYLLAGAFGLHALAIFLTFSRSAWLALFVALLFVVWLRFGRPIIILLRRFWPIVIGVVLVAGATAFTLRNTVFFQQYIIHSNPQEEVADLDSNELHTLLLRQGLEGVADKPLGHGPGTAGLVSIQNPNGGQLTENYYVQIGYEIGVAGALLFIVLNVWLFVRLWKRHDYVATILCASFCAYVVTNMLLHTWSNEAVAAQWWLLAGMALVSKKPD